MKRLLAPFASVLGLALLLAGCAAKEETTTIAPPKADDKSGTPPEPAKLDFVKDVRPTLEAYCLPCHGGKGQKGVTLDALATNESAAANAVVFREMAEEIEAGKMPPKTAKQLPDDVKAKLIADLKSLGG